MFEKIISELKEIDYRGMIHLSWYNEPLADKDILGRIKRIKEVLPDVYIRFTSNGDYLDKDYLIELVDAGLNEISITRHMLPGATYSDEVARGMLFDFCEKLGIQFVEKGYVPNNNIWMDEIISGIRIIIASHNWGTYGTDRGGMIKNLSVLNRKEPCCNPFRELVIDIDGDARFCCNLFEKSRSIGNVMNMSILEMYFSDAMIKVRRNLLVYGDKINPCNTCNTMDAFDKSQKSKAKKLLESVC